VTEFGKFLVVVGLIVTVAGLLLWAGVGKGWLGKLPGDITYSKATSNSIFRLPHAWRSAWRYRSSFG
jgi:hypothetical protein